MPNPKNRRSRRKPLKSKLLKRLSLRLESASELQGNPKLIEELELYLQEAPLIPRYINAQKRKTVNEAQRILSELDSKLTRVVTIQFEVSKIQQSLIRLEILAKRELLDLGVISDRMTRPAVSNVLSLYLPKLTEFENEWAAAEKLCTLVQQRLADSKDSLRLQMKLDDNARWAGKISP